MQQSLIGVHAALGELGAWAFLWIFVELLAPDLRRVRRAQIAATAGAGFFVLSWIVGGYYYLEHYGPHVKPIVLGGPFPAGHRVFMEAKEHIFLFLPFLALYAWSVLRVSGDRLMSDAAARYALLGLSAIIFATGIVMAGMGYVISISARMGFESGVHLP